MNKLRKFKIIDTFPIFIIIFGLIVHYFQIDIDMNTTHNRLNFFLSDVFLFYLNICVCILIIIFNIYYIKGKENRNAKKFLIGIVSFIAIFYILFLVRIYKNPVYFEPPSFFMRDFKPSEPYISITPIIDDLGLLFIFIGYQFFIARIRIMVILVRYKSIGPNTITISSEKIKNEKEYLKFLYGILIVISLVILLGTDIAILILNLFEYSILYMYLNFLAGLIFGYGIFYCVERYLVRKIVSKEGEIKDKEGVITFVILILQLLPLIFSGIFWNYFLYLDRFLNVKISLVISFNLFCFISWYSLTFSQFLWAIKYTSQIKKDYSE
ncbi:MAG: hypothetical protein GF329_03210 [Candidatus Lokiarchaeota archaeon]|nr:hypothetical protein [Candidatus Lokiarchaeota archaeon]